MKLSPQNMLRIQLLISALLFFMLGGNMNIASLRRRTKQEKTTER
jgi:hypothetical protein